MYMSKSSIPGQFVDHGRVYSQRNVVPQNAEKKNEKEKDKKSKKKKKDTAAIKENDDNNLMSDEMKLLKMTEHCNVINLRPSSKNILYKSQYGSMYRLYDTGLAKKSMTHINGERVDCKLKNAFNSDLKQEKGHAEALTISSEQKIIKKIQKRFLLRVNKEGTVKEWIEELLLLEEKKECDHVPKSQPFNDNKHNKSVIIASQEINKLLPVRNAMDTASYQTVKTSPEIKNVEKDLFIVGETIPDQAKDKMFVSEIDNSLEVIVQTPEFLLFVEEIAIRIVGKIAPIVHLQHAIEGYASTHSLVPNEDRVGSMASLVIKEFASLNLIAEPELHNVVASHRPEEVIEMIATLVAQVLLPSDDQITKNKLLVETLEKNTENNFPVGKGTASAFSPTEDLKEPSPCRPVEVSDDQITEGDLPVETEYASSISAVEGIKGASDDNLPVEAETVSEDYIKKERENNMEISIISKSTEYCLLSSERDNLNSLIKVPQVQVESTLEDDFQVELESDFPILPVEDLKEQFALSTLEHQLTSLEQNSKDNLPVEEESVSKYLSIDENNIKEKKLESSIITKSTENDPLTSELDNLESLIEFKQLEVKIIQMEYRKNTIRKMYEDIQKMEDTFNYDEQSPEGKYYILHEREIYIELRQMILDDQINLIKWNLDFLRKNHVGQEHKDKLISKIKRLLERL